MDDTVDIREALIGAFDQMKPNALSAIEAETKRTFLGTKHLDFLVLVDDTGKVYRPEASMSYAQALWSFIRNQPHEGRQLNTLVSQSVTEAVGSALQGSLVGDRTQEAFTAALRLPAEKLQMVTAVSDGYVTTELEWLTREVKGAAGLPGAETMQTKLALLASDQVALFFKTAAGAAVLAAFAKVASTTGGKVLIAKAVNLAFLKLSTSVALKSVAIAAAKKIGIVILLKTILVGAITSIDPRFRAERVGPFLLIPLVAFLITKAVWDFPKKLANEAPGEITKKMSAEWRSISEMLADALLLNMTQTDWSTLQIEDGRNA